MDTTRNTRAPYILQLTIERFRGIERLVWNPAPGANVILGAGDVGKTTILEAIALLLSPTNNVLLTDADYWRRDVDAGFCIEAVMSLPDTCGINQQTKHAWPWEWDGLVPKLPVGEGEPSADGNAFPVYRLRVRGTPEFDAAFEMFQPDATADHFGVAVRRKIGLVRLGGDDRNDRDLRLLQGSALDRLLSDKTLRARLGQKLSQNDIDGQLKDEAKGKLGNLETAFQKKGLPTGLGLGLTGSLGFSLNALIGLTATKDEVVLPLAAWGAGTRRLAALEIAAAHQGDSPITLVDELERGLEPYRQRLLMATLQGSDSQIFLTTHSAAALKAVSTGSLWYVDSKGVIGLLTGSVAPLLKADPEAFFARVAIVAEGATEVGFVTALLKKAIGPNLLEWGISVPDGGGNEQTLNILDGLTGSGLAFGGFADDEGRYPGKWAAIQKKLGPLLFRWTSGCLEENIIALVPAERLEEFIQDPSGELTGERQRTLADRLRIDSKEFSAIKVAAPDLTKLLIEAATGAIPDDRKDGEKSEIKAFRKHAERWFKSVDGGRELAGKVFALGLWPQLEVRLLPFLNAVRRSVYLPDLSSLPS